MMWLSDKGRVDAYPPTPRGTLLGVVWRTTALGRTVRVVGRRIEPFQEGPSNRFGPPYRPWPPLCHLDPDHAVTRQFTGSDSEVIAVCACGEVGPPDRLAWEAEGVCGPCHDHKVDTGSPLEPAFGPAALRTEGQIRRVGWLPSGDELAAWEWLPGGYGHASSRLVVWDRHTAKLRTPEVGATIKAIPRTKFASGLVLPANGTFWFPPGGKPSPLTRPDHGWSDMAFHGTTAAVLRYNGEVSRRDLTAEGAWEPCWPERVVDRGESYYVLAFDPKGGRVAVGRRRGVIEVLDFPDGPGEVIRPDIKEERRIDYRMHALAFSPDGKHVASANGLSGFVEDPAQEWYGWGGSLHLLDMEKRECVAQFPRERDDILCVAFSPDGSLLFSGATDCQIRVVDVASRKEVAVLCGHVGCVNHLAFSPDGETLASAGGDGLVRLWPWRKVLGLPAPAAKAPAAETPTKPRARKKR